VTIRLVTRNMTRLYPSQTLAAKYSVNFHNSQVRLNVYPLEMSDLPPLLLFPLLHADDPSGVRPIVSACAWGCRANNGGGCQWSMLACPGGWCEASAEGRANGRLGLRPRLGIEGGKQGIDLWLSRERPSSRVPASQLQGFPSRLSVNLTNRFVILRCLCLSSS